MNITFETAENETTFDLRDSVLPRQGEFIDWSHPPTNANQLPLGVYRVEQVTHLFSHGTMSVRVGLVLTRLK